MGLDEGGRDFCQIKGIVIRYLIQFCDRKLSDQDWLTQRTAVEQICQRLRGLLAKSWDAGDLPSQVLGWGPVYKIEERFTREKQTDY